jgi:hypothetical protein
MTYLPEESRIIYRSKDKRQEKAFDALDWLAAMTSPLPGAPSKGKKDSLIPSTSPEDLFGPSHLTVG